MINLKNDFYKPLPFWSWNDKLNIEELKRQIDCFAAAGCGGFFIHSRVGLITPYLSEEWMELVRQCCIYANEKGLRPWLYDEDMWPSGYAGGRVPAQSETYRDRWLSLILKNELRETDEIKSEYRNYLIVRRVACSENARFNGQSYIDTLNPEAVRAFLDCTLEAYAAYFKNNLSKYVEGIFTDEPCYIMRAFSDRLSVPYSECMDALFESACGKKLSENLYQLFFDVGDFREIRFHYYRCLSERFTESFVKQYASRCAVHGIKLTGHLMGEENTVTQTAWIGSAMANYPWFDIPGVDKIFRGTRDLVQYKQLTSVGEQFGKERALCECFAGLGQECGMLGRKKIVDFQAVNGITLVNPHLSLYSMRGERKRDYPPNLFFQQPFFEHERAFSEYTARISEAAGFGRRDVRILVVHPLATTWSRFRPRRSGILKKEKCDALLEKLSYALQARGIEFHYGDERILADKASVSDGKLILGDYIYDKIALCGNDVLVASTLKLLSSLAVYALQESVLKDGKDRVRLPSAVLCEDIEDMTERLAAEIAAPFRCTAGEIISCTRKSRTEKLMLFVNRSDRTGKIVFTGAIRGAVGLDLISGNKYRFDPEGFSVFQPYESKVLLFGETSETSLPKRGALLAEYLPKVRVCGENALCLDRADLTMAGKTAAENEHLSKLWHTEFYPAKDGTPFAAEYKFFYESGRPRFAAVENAENLEEISLNGTVLCPLRRKGERQILDERSYMDPSLTRVPLEGVREGWNCLRLAGKKFNNVSGIGTHRGLTSSEYYPTELEFVYIVGGFTVKDGRIFREGESVSGNIVQKGFPYYAGKIEATVDCDCKTEKQVTLEIKNGRAACYALYADGVFEGCRFAPPYCWPIALSEGRHSFRIEADNTLFNMFGPRYIKGYRTRKWVTAWDAADETLYRKEETFERYELGKIFLYETRF